MPIGDSPMAPGMVRKLAYSIMNDDQVKEYEATMEANLAISISGLGRFRVNVFRQRGDVAMVIRYIKGKIPSIEDLNLPQKLKRAHNGATRIGANSGINRLWQIHHSCLHD